MPEKLSTTFALLRRTGACPDGYKKAAAHVAGEVLVLEAGAADTRAAL